MTIHHTQIMINAATFALRGLMGYPQFAPTAHTIAFCSGGERDVEGANWICQMVQESGNDVVHVNFGADSLEPISVSLALRQTLYVDWHLRVQLYAASEEASIELLTSQHRWAVGSRHVLIAKPLPSRSKIKAGVERAARRWRETTLSTAEGPLPTAHLLPVGSSFANAMPDQGDATIVRMFA
ncbi:hypothetical protein [Sphingobium chlorophenolicum]|uniref:Uncharacterized protein n=1 Tax=Sphingobium chlorophenolicum TaxID=46429 RepID=A0A081RGQ1_SPHCR|nr:hypothetical protein [Sphingobium chlorophenolicum]KEQ54374.1 hypothetical protein BV95_01439 [Sphingobium chlorophenolicum]